MPRSRSGFVCITNVNRPGAAKKPHRAEPCGVEKPPPVPFSGAFENPHCMWAPQARFTDPTSLLVGLHAPDKYWLPAGATSVRQKCRPFTYTAEVFSFFFLPNVPRL